MDSSHPTNADAGGAEQIAVTRRRITFLEICDITLDELDNLEKVGSDVGLDFNVALASFTVALSFAATLATTKIESRVTQDTFMVFVVVGVVGALIFGIKWWKNRGAFSTLIKRIKDRQTGPIGQSSQPQAQSVIGENALPPREPILLQGPGEPESSAAAAMPPEKGGTITT